MTGSIIASVMRLLQNPDSESVAGLGIYTASQNCALGKLGVRLLAFLARAMFRGSLFPSGLAAKVKHV